MLVSEISEREIRMTSTDIFNDDKLMQRLGAKLITGEHGHVVIELKVTEHLVQRHNPCQGGAIFAFADAAFGIAANNTGQSAVSQHCTISFLRPAPLGETVRAEAKRRSTTGRTDIFHVEVTDSSGNLIAEFRGNTHILKSSLS
jgi:acyl-CoA thioesterase